MSDQFKEITTRSWGSRIIGSFQGVIFGFLLFIISFGVLYWNEGRVDISKIAQTAIKIEATSEAQPEANEQLVSTTGVFQSNEQIGDTFLQEGSYISIKRNVEMYAWEEDSQSKSQRNTGGSETTETTYTYTKNWTNSPDDSSDFKQPQGHQNPQMPIRNDDKKVNNATIGIYAVDMNQLSLPPHRTIKLNENNVLLVDDFALASDQYLFKGNGTINAPQIGDIRVSYSVVESPLDMATIFGKLDVSNKTISPYYGIKDIKLYSAHQGSHDTAISGMRASHKVFTWILRAVGFLLMWFGLMALFGPISVLLDVLPIFGSISRFGIGMITFIVSFILTVITIIVSMIVHNVIALTIVILVCIAGGILYVKNKRKHQLASSTSTN